MILQNKLKIISPFRGKKEVLPLIYSGADELYCGYLPSEWVRRYTALEFERKGGGSNFTDINELGDAVTIAHENNVPVYLALNGLYIKEQYGLLLRIIKQLNKIDLDGYIVADLGLLLTLKKMGFKKQVHISTGGAVFNQEAVNFYKKLGAKRIILDRQTSLNTIAKISSGSPKMEFEVFILNTLCVNIDGLCTFMHSPADLVPKNLKQFHNNLNIYTIYDPCAFQEACSLKYSVQAYNQSRSRLISGKIRPAFYKQLVDGVECNACSLYSLKKMNVKFLKIVGRQLSSEARLVSTRFIRSVLNILEDNPRLTKEEFILEVQGLYRNYFSYSKKCRGNNCYHPKALRYGKSSFN
jgi:collagenase-like PrtC family protease